MVRLTVIILGLFWVMTPGWTQPPIKGKEKSIFLKAQKALGNQSKLKGIKTIQFQEQKSSFLKSLYTFSFPQGFNRTVVARHGSLQFIIQGKNSAVVETDNKGKIGRVQKLKPSEHKELLFYGREFLFPLIAPVMSGIRQAQFLEERKMHSGPLKGRRVRIVDFEYQTGDRYRAYFSRDYRFLIMLESIIQYHKLKGKKRTVLYDQYREVGGILIPHKIYMQTQGEPKRTLQFKVIVNPKLSSKTFTIPEGKDNKERQ